MNNKIKWDKRFLELSKLVSNWSKDPSTQTGAVIVRPDKTVASIGFNGFPKDMPDFQENYLNREEKYSRIIHCEMNAMIFCPEKINGYTLYTYPLLSCDRCAVHMIQAGIKRFVTIKASQDILSRWGDKFKKVEQYAREAGVEITEYDSDICQ